MQQVTHSAQITILGALICTRNDHLNLMTNILPFHILCDQYLVRYTSKVMSNVENPFRSTLLNYSRPTGHRALRFKPPLCTRIIKLFSKLPINFKQVSSFPYHPSLFSGTAAYFLRPRKSTQQEYTRSRLVDVAQLF